jgi:predicted ester cyclase
MKMEGGTNMSIEENKALINYYFSPPPPSPEVIQRLKETKDPMQEITKFFRSHFESIFSPDFIGHDSSGDWNREQILQVNLEFMAAFPDLSWGMEKMVAENDLIVVLGKMQGTHRGIYKGIPPTGKKVKMTYTSTYRVENGKVVETWSNLDWLGLMQQIGAIPYTEVKK